jgi:hypothetical protein
MYEKPKLNRVGDAQDVILGMCSSGNDMDMTWIPGGMGGLQFADDAEDLEARN